MTINEEEAIERLKRIDIKFFLSGMNEQSNYIVDEADKVNKAIETVLNLIQTHQAEIEKKDKMIDEIQEEVLDHIGFENRLKRDNREPDLFNQGRFYVADNIKNILEIK